MRISFAAPVGQDAVHFAVGLTFDEVLAAVPMCFSGAQTDKNLEATVFQVTLEGNEGATALFFDLSEKANDFCPVKKEFPGALGFEVRAVAVAVGGNVERVEPGLAVFNFPVGMGEISATGAEGFDFGSGQDNAGLDGFLDGKIVTGFPVVDFDRFQGA